MINLHGFKMPSQPSDRRDGSDGKEDTGDVASKFNVGLDAELDRAVPAGEAEAFLIGVSGKESGRVYALSYNTVSLGRASDSDVYVSDPSVSARHARILNGSQGFEIEDLGSTNGTFVNGQRIRRSRLQGGDRVMLGQAEFNFLFDRPAESTVAVFSPQGIRGGALMRIPAPYIPPESLRPGRALEEDEERGPSLAETIVKLVGVYRFIRRYARLIAGVVAAGASLGLLSIVVIPAAAQAVCEVKLQPQVKTNPMDPQARNNDEDAIQFFAGAERAFGSADLIAQTFKGLSGRVPSESEIKSIAGRLKFEPLPDHIYRASYKDKTFGARQPDPVEFLTSHLQNYVQTEIDKALRVFTAQADFLRDQMRSVEKEMGDISAERTKFREKNVDRLPEEAGLAQSSQYTLETHRADLMGQIRRLQGELDANRQALVAEVPVNQTRFQASQVYRQSLAEVKRKLSEAYARGLADGHPEVAQLNDEKARLEALIDKEMHSDTSQVDRQSNVGLQEVRAKVALLQAQLSAARADLTDTEKTLGQLKHVVGDMPRVEERVKQLTHTQEATTQLHSQLFEQLKKAELQLSLERVSAESRYDVVVPPRLDKMGKMRLLVMRGAIGVGLGLLVAAIFIAIKEGKRIVGQAMATMTDQPDGVSWR